MVAALVITTVEVGRALGWDTGQIRTQLVLSLVFAHLMLAYVARASRHTFEAGWWRSRVLRTAVGASLALQAVVTAVPAAGGALSFVPLPPLGWVLAAAAALLTPVLCDLVRLLLGEASAQHRAQTTISRTKTK